MSRGADPEARFAPMHGTTQSPTLSGDAKLCMYDVLILDDEAVVRDVLVELLEDRGLSVKAVATPGEARSIVLGGPGCSLLLTDIDLGQPDEDGFGVAAAVRVRCPELPVLFISGRPWRLAEHTPAAHDRVLAKPFRTAALMRAVDQLLNRPDGF